MAKARTEGGSRTTAGKGGTGRAIRMVAPKSATTRARPSDAFFPAEKLDRLPSSPLDVEPSVATLNLSIADAPTLEQHMLPSAIVAERAARRLARYG